MDDAVRQLVRKRADYRCEYCRVRQSHIPLSPLQIEHVVPKKHHGDDDPANLALACDRCNLHKGTNVAGIDADSGQVVPLYNPRQQAWDEHFELVRFFLEGTTLTGRVTVDVLNMNEDRRVFLRETLMLLGEAVI